MATTVLTPVVDVLPEPEKDTPLSRVWAWSWPKLLAILIVLAALCRPAETLSPRAAAFAKWSWAVVAAIAIDNSPPVAFYHPEWAIAERAILHAMFDALQDAYDPARMTRPTFIGHNIVSFDLRFLFQRAVLNGVLPPSIIPFNARPWDTTVFDTMTAWAGVGNRVSLDKLCSAFGIAKKGSEIGDDIDGSKVWDYVRTGRIADVVEYCKGDVERVRAIHRRMTFAEAA